jgi:hypothetical protein
VRKILDTTNYFQKWQAKDGTPEREAYLLSTLQSISAWRGHIVDQTISRNVINALKNGKNSTLHKALDYAKYLYDIQLEYALNHKVREPGMSKSKVDNSFAAFYKIEYEGSVPEEEYRNAWIEIKEALTNFFKMDELKSLLKKAALRIPQRPLKFTYSNTNIAAQPDLICFFNDEKPLIVDWKVHVFGIKDYRLQLALYTIALKCCKPHSDFPSSLENYTEKDICLIEAQLLTNQQRQYVLAEQDIIQTQNYTSESITQMQLAGGDEPKNSVPEDYPTTNYPETCLICPYRKICWEAL